MLSGKKTYLVAFGSVLLALGGYLHGDLTLFQAGQAVLASGALAALRDAIKTHGFK